MFQPIYRYSKKVGDTDHISAWKSEGLSDKSIKPPATSDNSLASSLNYIGVTTRLKFDGGCLKQNKVTFIQGKTVKIYAVSMK